MITVKTFLLVACCSVMLWSAVAAHAVILDNGLTENGLTENGIIDNGITENGIIDNGLTENARAEKPMVFNQTCARRNSEHGLSPKGRTDNGRSTYQSEGLSFHGLSQKSLGKTQP